MLSSSVTSKVTRGMVESTEGEEEDVLTEASQESVSTQMRCNWRVDAKE